MAASDPGPDADLSARFAIANGLTGMGVGAALGGSGTNRLLWAGISGAMGAWSGHSVGSRIDAKLDAEVAAKQRFQSVPGIQI